MQPILVGSNFTGFKNRIINGDFSVWQRGESFTIAANSGAAIADRFTTSLYSPSGQIGVSKSTIRNKNSIRFTVDTAVSDITSSYYFHGLYYKFEGQHLYDLATSGANITLSFWFNSNVAGDYAVSLRNTTNSSLNLQTYTTSFRYGEANMPQKIELTIPLNHQWNPGLINDANIGFMLIIGFLNNGNFATPTKDTWIDGNYLTVSTAVNWVATAGNFIEIAELQLEEGTYATDFEYVPYDIQLLRCKRYYEKAYPAIFSSIRAYKTSIDGGNADNYWQFVYFFEVEKRVTPTVLAEFYTEIPTYNPDRLSKKFVSYSHSSGFECRQIEINAEL